MQLSAGVARADWRIHQVSVQWNLELYSGAFRLVGDQHHAPAELLGNLILPGPELAQGWSISKIAWKANALIRDFDMQVGPTPFAGHLDYAEPARVRMFGRICHKLVDQEAERDRLVG